MASGRRDVKFSYTKFADFFDNDRQTFDQLSATFRQFKNWPNWIVSSDSEQSEGTYIADVIIPLLRTSLSNLSNGAICLSTAEHQSIASKAQRNLGIIR